MHLSVAEARALSEGILRRHGFEAAEATEITDVLVEAHLWGRPTSGLNHLRYVVKAAADRRPVCVLREDSRSVLLDGGNNPGFLVAQRAMRMAIEKARESGLAAAAAHNAYLGGINGYYAVMAARQDLIGLVTISSGRRVAPAGGIDPLFGTNPLAIAIPTLDEPIVLDMATASTNVGSLRRAERLHEAIAEGQAVTADGSPTTDPATALGGAILPFGGHKGSGLAMIVQCLGMLAGGAIVPEGIRDFGYFLLAIDPALFMPAADYKARTSELAEMMRASRPAAAGDPVRVPGERSMRARARRLIEGFDLDDELYRELLEL
jgi:LDH2 family malate/lactate/ureidoglycolate dehydrogenase